MGLKEKGLHSWELTWKPKRGPIKTTVPLKWAYMGFHVSLGECMVLGLEQDQWCYVAFGGGGP